LSPLQWTEARNYSTIRSGIGAEGNKEEKKQLSSQYFCKENKKD